MIPQGEYGGGTVMLWDEDEWTPIEGRSAKDLEKGHLHFRLEASGCRGGWLLIRLRPSGKEKREKWLLRKIEDEFAGATGRGSCPRFASRNGRRWLTAFRPAMAGCTR